MKIVADIKDDDYYDIIGGALIGEFTTREVINAVKNGTPLPKGHGRLIDADSMKTMKNIQSANFNAVELIRLWIDKQDTIIEADKAESENKE